MLFFHPPQASSHKHVGQTTADMTAGSDLCSTVMIAPSPQAFSSFKRWWPCMYVLEIWLSQMPGWGWYDTQRAICTPPIRSLYCSMNETSSNIHFIFTVFSCLNFTTEELQDLVWNAHIPYTCMGTCPFPPAAPLPRPRIPPSTSCYLRGQSKAALLRVLYSACWRPI